MGPETLVRVAEPGGVVRVMLEYPFSGSRLAAVDAAGKLPLPPFVRDTLDRRGRADSLLIGRHEEDPCLIAYDRPFAAIVLADVERRRLAEEAIAPQLHHARARRAFGFVAAVEVEAGAIVLPELMRRRAAIGAQALLVGTGGMFEIWDAQVALERGDPDLRELANFFLNQKLAA